MGAFCRNYIFLIRLMLLICLITLVGSMSLTQNWPKFCLKTLWPYFNNIGVFMSLITFEFSTLITWIIFENANWVFYTLTYFIHGFLLLTSGIIYFTQFQSECRMFSSSKRFSTTEIVYEITILCVGLFYVILESSMGM
ncbi:hypothetical protein Phum_PHUM155190 [Pediculus humanus corporis]|uniref:Uncharacterized protein n=1 Tax=Pediculus humanus subsp. corporis TaxID=121224 RepID=E0VFD4_PEDHC|nr:uncharacterized protein Phum_PHUM155190 [Pediculus humanus corporis]EEB12090.1 hypothetical protein Phum_PHUM155190 [Pediculus humanus corporis]